MRLLFRFWEGLKRVFKRQRGGPARLGRTVHGREVAGSNPALVTDVSRRGIVTRNNIRPPSRARRLRKPGYQAAHQDISRFMKHGRQTAWYRRSVKAKKRPEDD